MKRYAVESNWGPGFWINALEKTKKEAEAKLAELKSSPVWPKGTAFRIVAENVPDDPDERFSHVISRLVNEQCCIDDEALTGFSVHISWGDWKHEHLRADAVFGMYGFTLVESYIDEEDGSDCYSGWHTYECS